MSTPIGSSQWMYASGEAVTQQSLKFNDDESQYLSWTPAAAGNRKTMTLSVWAKRGNLGSERVIFTTDAAANNTSRLQIRFGGGNDLRLAGQSTLYLATSALFRDVSSWYHIVLAINTTEATASDRLKLWVNGEQITAFSSTSYPSQNSDLPWNLAQLHGIGSDAGGIGSSYFDGYLSDIHFIDGQALDASSFGETVDGYWKAIDYAGSYGTNGFHLTFEDDVVSEGFNAVTYRGDGNNTASISGLGFSPDLLWIKNRTDSSNQNLMDSVRGASVRLLPSATLAEVSSFLGSFDGDGFTFSGGNDNDVNQAGDSYVAWAWDAGSGSPVSNTDGSITSSVKANPSYGFSITSYTGNFTAGATIGHGLSSAPEMVIVKARSFGPSAWSVYTATTGAGDELLLNTTAASAASAITWNNTAPTSSVFTVGTAGSTNLNAETYIAYCFHSVAGYSSIGSYSGTGAAGNAVNCGFRPAFLMYKNTTTAEQWAIVDTTREPSGTLDNNLYANAATAEDTNSIHDVEFTSTGFTLNGTHKLQNASGNTYLYYAVADSREAAFWKDVSGQGNHWTPNNLDYRDSLIDSPANNFCVYNPLDANTSTLSEGNLKVATASTTSVPNTRGTFAVNSGKWYWEIITVDSSSSLRIQSWVGLASTERATNSVVKVLVATGNGIIYGNNGSLQSGLTAWSQYDVIGVALDCGNTSVQFYRNGSAYGSAVDYSSFIPSTEFLTPFIIDGASSVVCTTVSNFGQDSTFSGVRPAGGNQDDNGIGDFAYAPPSGYLALCTANLPTPTIVDGSEHFNTVLWTGDGTSGQAITGVGFQPDMVYYKSRSNSGAPAIYDSVRGAGAGKMLSTNQSSSEGVDTPYTDTDYGFVSSFDSDGFSVASGAVSGPWVNQSGVTYAAWNWKAGGTAVSNTDGSITSQVSANTTAGFSIASYTGNGGVQAGDNVGHGLLQTPEVIIVKNRNAASNWNAWWSTFVGSNQVIYPNLTNAQNTDGNVWSSTLPTSNVFYVGNGEVNGSGQSHIAYCFHSVDGFSKVGSFTGNGNADGPFVYTGFRPAWVMVKQSSAAGGWNILDNKRQTFNDATGLPRLFADSSAAEADANTMQGQADFLSNGFKLRSNHSSGNTSGATIIYLAFAKTPLKFANAR